jgi:hypothetical protein
VPIAPIRTFRIARVDPVAESQEASEYPVNLKASITYPAGTILGELIGTDEVQTVTIAGGATGGTFTITFGGQTTSPIPYGSSAAVVQAALEALSSIGVGNIQVSKAADVYTLVFRDALGSQNVAQVTASAAGLTGGTPTITPATTTAGVAGTPGVYGPYASGNTDGSQNPKGILRYACVTDALGVITLGTGGAGVSEWGQTTSNVDMWASGIFRCEDLVGLDANAVTKLGRLMNGTVAHGRLAVFGV